MLRIVLDTNVLLVSISDRSRLHWVFKKLVEKKYTLCVTTDILAEYAEIIEEHMGSEASEAFELHSGKPYDYIPAYPIETYSNKQGWRNLT